MFSSLSFKCFFDCELNVSWCFVHLLSDFCKCTKEFEAKIETAKTFVFPEPAVYTVLAAQVLYTRRRRKIENGVFLDSMICLVQNFYADRSQLDDLGLCTFFGS